MIRARPSLVLAVVAGGTLLSTLAGSAVTLALPAIGADLRLSLEGTRWVMLALLVTVTVALLPCGRLGDLIGHRNVYLAGFLLFALTSGLCGLAQGLPTLIAGRALQGLAGALVMAAAPALVTTTLPAASRGRSLGLLSSATYVGLTFGPPLGGWLLAMLDWRWIFFVNVPVAAVICLAGQRLLPPVPRASGLRFDTGGATALVLSGALLLVALSEGQYRGWLSPAIVIGLAAGLAGSVFFVLLQRRRREPLLDLGLFQSRTFSAASLAAVCNYVALFIPIILLPYYFAEGRQVSPSHAGLLLSAQPLLMAFSASPSGALSDRVGTRGLAAAGMVLLAAGLWGLGRLGPASSLLAAAAWLALTGVGTGLFISPNSSALMGAAPGGQQGVAGAVMAVARNLGMMLGVTAASQLFAAAGGHTGRPPWRSGDYAAMRWALLHAAAVALLGAVLALLSRSRPRPERHGP